MINAHNRFVVSIDATEEGSRATAQRLVDLAGDDRVDVRLGDTARASYLVTLNDIGSMRNIRHRLRVLAFAIQNGAELRVEDPTVFSVQAVLFDDAAEALRDIAAGRVPWWRRLARRAIRWLARRV